jgi:hypothetical protein
MYRAKRAELGADVYVEAIHGSLDEIAARVSTRPAVRLRDRAARQPDLLPQPGVPDLRAVA